MPLAVMAVTREATTSKCICQDLARNSPEISVCGYGLFEMDGADNLCSVFRITFPFVLSNICDPFHFLCEYAVTVTVNSIFCGSMTFSLFLVH